MLKIKGAAISIVIEQESFKLSGKQFLETCAHDVIAIFRRKSIVFGKNGCKTKESNSMGQSYKQVESFFTVFVLSNSL